MDDCLELAALEPGRELSRRHNICDLMLCEVAPFGIVATQQIADDDIGRPRLIEAGNGIDPINPAPPVTKNILALAQAATGKPLPQPAARRNLTLFGPPNGSEQGKNRGWTGPAARVTAASPA